MSGILSSLLRVLPETVAARGLDASPLWARMGLSPGADQPGQRVSLSDWVATLDLAHALTGDPTVGLRAAQAVRPLHLGPLGYALMSSGHGADGLAVFERFQAQLCDSLAVRMALEPGTVVLHHEPVGEPLPHHAGFWVFLLGARLAFGRWVSGRDLVHSSLTLCAPPPEPALAEAFARFAQCPVHWHPTEAAERFPLDWLSWLNPHADAQLHALMHRQLEQSQPSADAGERLLQTVSEAVRVVMARGQELELATVVAQWQAMPGHDEHALSTRQLQERLTDLGQPFKTLVDRVRREEALRLLRESRLPLAEVALACGYAEPSPFHRAVKRWTGLTPAQVREGAA
ncbi:MAG: hypothetical protein RI907_2206 [Pseudomonadota bacterium]|jgi:hypothetical protein